MRLPTLVLLLALCCPSSTASMLDLGASAGVGCVWGDWSACGGRCGAAQRWRGTFAAGRGQRCVPRTESEPCEPPGCPGTANMLNMPRDGGSLHERTWAVLGLSPRGGDAVILLVGLALFVAHWMRCPKPKLPMVEIATLCLSPRASLKDRQA
eukprot:EG_transcript_24524